MNKTMKNILLVLALALLVCLCAVGCTPSVQEIPPEGEYGYANPDGVKAEPDAGFVIDEDSPEDIMDVFGAADDGDGYDE